MKRLISLLLALTMMLILSSCAASPVDQKTQPEQVEESAEENSAEEEPVEEEPAPVKVGLFYNDFAWFARINFLEQMSEILTAMTLDFTEYDAQNSQEIQNEQIDEAIANGINLLMVAIVDPLSDTAHAVIDKAKEADIPIVFFDRWIDIDIMNTYDKAYFVSTDSSAEGEYQGKMIGEYLLEHYDEVDKNGDGKISYLMMKGNPGNPHCEGLALYSVEYCNEIITAAGYPEIEYYNPEIQDIFDKYEHGGYRRDLTEQIITNALEEHPMDGEDPIEMFISHSDMTMGIVDALNAIGYNDGGENYAPVFDAGYRDLTEPHSGVTGVICWSTEFETEALTALVKSIADGDEPYEGLPDYCILDEMYNWIHVPYETVMAKND